MLTHTCTLKQIGNTSIVVIKRTSEVDGNHVKVKSSYKKPILLSSIPSTLSQNTSSAATNMIHRSHSLSLAKVTASLALVLISCIIATATAKPMPFNTRALEAMLNARDDAPTTTTTASSCSSYIIIQSRGTNEKQGPSEAFLLMNALVLQNVPNGAQYFTVYPASIDQASYQATDDIINRIQQAIQIDPKQCIVLQGYSQGAAATVNALNMLNGTAADAVRAVYLVGNPLRKPDLSCNIDDTGGNSTANAIGLQLNLLNQAKTVPDAFLQRTLDVCISGDGVCDSKNGFGYGQDDQHLLYETDMNVQTIGYIFVTSMLNRNSFTRFTLPSTLNPAIQEEKQKQQQQGTDNPAQ